MKTFVITVSTHYPAYHPKKFIETNFGHSLFYGLKKHTIRGNYKFWKRRVDIINAGEAILSVRQWMGKPYCSKQFELIQFKKIGIQKCDVEIYNKKLFITINDKLKYMMADRIIKNDGLTNEDFKAWFKKPIIEGCILHFTELLY